MIYYNIGWDMEKNIGKAYNRFMEMLPNQDDYACFLDGDAMFLTSDFGTQLENIIVYNPQYKLLTCLTNRVGCPYQISRGCPDHDDIKDHRQYATHIQNTHQYKVENIETYKLPHYKNFHISGVLMLIEKGTWEKIGKFNTEGMLGIDNNIHKKAIENNIKVGIMEGVYIYHWYRGGGKRSQQPPTHLIKK